MFDLRTEAEMRLYSEKTARELASKRQRAEGGEHEAADRTTAPRTDGERADDPAAKAPDVPSAA